MKSPFKTSPVEEYAGPPAPKESHGWRIYAIASCASMAAAMAGYDNAFIGGTISLPSFQRTFHLTDSTRTQLSSNIVSVIIAGCIIGSIAAYPIAEKWGRKKAIVASAIISAIGGVMQLLSSGRIGLLYAGRAVNGLGIGALATVVPIFLAEVSPPGIRGRLVGMADMSVMVAQVLGFWINYGVQRHVSGMGDRQWLIPFGVQLIPAGLVVLLAPVMIESPRWLVMQGREEEATRALAWARGVGREHGYVQWEMGCIKEQVSKSEVEVGRGWRAVKVLWGEMMKRGMRRRLVMAVGTKGMHSMTGISALTLYSPLIFKNIGFPDASDQLLLTGIYGAVKVCAAAIFLIFLIDTWGRRKTVLTGSILIVLCQFYLGTYAKLTNSFTHASTHPNAGAYPTLVAIYIFGSAYSFSWAIFPFVFTSEIFPTRLRALAVALVNLVQWIMHFVVAYSIPYMLRDLQWGTFYFFGAATVVSTGLLWAFYPETKGWPLERMGVLFEGRLWVWGKRREVESRCGLEEGEDGDEDGSEQLNRKKTRNGAEKEEEREEKGIESGLTEIQVVEAKVAAKD